MCEPCLKHGEATIFGPVLRKCEDLLGMAVEVERALDGAGARPLQVSPPYLQPIDTAAGVRPPHSNPSVGAAASDVSMRRRAGRAVNGVLPRAVAVGAISRRVSLARVRSIPVILGMPAATTVIRSGSLVAVDGVAGIAR